ARRPTLSTLSTYTPLFRSRDGVCARPPVQLHRELRHETRSIMHRPLHDRPPLVGGCPDSGAVISLGDSAPACSRSTRRRAMEARSEEHTSELRHVKISYAV